MIKIRTCHAIMALWLAIFVLASCHRHSAPRYVIGVSQCSEDVWREKLNEELRVAAFYYNNVELRILSANDDVDLQTRQIDQFVDMKVDLLVVAPGQTQVSPAIERAYESGMPVIVFDRRTRSDKYTAYIGADNTEMGQNMAKYLAVKAKGKGRVLEICGQATSSPAVERGSGFDHELAHHAGMQIVDRVECDWTEQGAHHKMDSLLATDYPPFDYVFAHNDRMAVGARRAVLEHGLEHVTFVGMDAMPQQGGGMQLVRDGELAASYIYPTRGDEVMRLAMDILEHRPYKRDNLLSSALVTPDNASVLLMQYDEMQRQSASLMSLRDRMEHATNAFDVQRNYLLVLLVLVALLVLACILALKAYVAKAKYNLRLRQSMDKQNKMTADMERMTQVQLRFFTNVSHELRTPLTLISGPVDQLAESAHIRGEDMKMVQMVRRNVGILKQMVGEILEFRKVQNEKAHLVLNRFDAAREVASWANDFEAVAKRKHLHMVTDVAQADSYVVIADREKLAHIYFNLMTNALKYTPDGGTITTRLTHHDGRLTLAVADTGKGISDEDKAHIFDRFYQTADSVGGTGIGLALVKAYTDLHHGEARVEANTPLGTTFIIDLPDQQPGYDEAHDHQAEIHAGGTLVDDDTAHDIQAEHNVAFVTGTEDYDSQRPLVLVIDDNANMRAYLKSVLAPEYNVVEARDGSEGLAVARKSVPQLVVSDVMMPVMDGLEFCRRLKSDVATSHIPVILLTARSLEEQRAEGYGTGADSYITKPFSADTLTARIGNLLQNRRLLRQIFSGSGQETSDEATLNECDRNFVARLRQVVKSHIPQADYSVEDLGAEMGLSRVQLYRKVKALTGYSVVDLLRKARLAKAKRLLETTDRNVSEVAYEVGFSTPSYFAKRFKEEYGVLPGDI